MARTVLTAFVLFTLLLFFSANVSAQGGLSKENLDLPYDALSLAEEDEDAPEVVIFYGQNYEGDGVFFCLDRSGSTANGELKIEKRETIRSITEFSARVQFGIVFYDAGVKKYPSTGRPLTASVGAKGGAISWLTNLRSGSGTCPGKGLMECLNYVSFSSAKRNVIIWLGDGCTTCPGGSGNYSQKTLTQVKSRNFKRAQINAIAVGGNGEVCESFPKSLAAQNNGTYKRVPR